jgi:amino acid transporter
MSSNVKDNKKLGLAALMLMIFTSVYGFNNIPRSFYKMGYAAIPWYILSAITFFVPFAFMVTEFGSAFKNERGGIYSWMDKSVGPKFAFVATFMWYASWIVWDVSVAPGIWVPISNGIFGEDRTATWSFLGIKALTGTKTLGILAIIFFIIVTFISTKGMDKIKKVTSVGGTAVVLTNILFIVCSIILLIAKGGHLAQPIEGLKSFAASPNPKFAGNPLITLSFVVYALFAYGGIETIGGLVDETKDPKKTFPKGVMLAALVITIGYSLNILLLGIFTNWNTVMTGKNVSLGNISYITMANLGYTIGTTFGASKASAIVVGQWVARYYGISMSLALLGCFFAMTYAPLKQMIEGTPKELWPGRLGEVNKDGFPVIAMWVQAAIVCVMIALVSFGGDSMQKFFDILTAMSNVATTLPYLFMSIAFIPFKKNTSIEKPFEIFKSYGSAVFWAVVVTATVGLADIFSAIEPMIDGDLKTTIWSVAGPVIFGAIALIMHKIYENKMKNKKSENVA